MVMPRAGASVKNPDVQLPILRSDGDGYYMEVRVASDSQDASEVAVTRRVQIEDLSEDEWEDIKSQYASLDLASCADVGLTKVLDKIQDRRLERLVMALLTFLNPRQVSIDL